MNRMQLNLANMPNGMAENKAWLSVKTLSLKLCRKAVRWYHWRRIRQEENFIIDQRELCAIQMHEILSHRDEMIRVAEASIRYHTEKRNSA